MTPWEFAVLALAVWRLSRLISLEDGPGMLLFRLRSRAVSLSPQPGGLGELLECPYCTSVWLGLLATACWAWQPQAMFWVSLPLALSAVTVIIQLLVPEKTEEREGEILED